MKKSILIAFLLLVYLSVGAQDSRQYPATVLPQSTFDPVEWARQQHQEKLQAEEQLRQQVHNAEYGEDSDSHETYSYDGNNQEVTPFPIYEGVEYYDSDGNYEGKSRYNNIERRQITYDKYGREQYSTKYNPIEKRYVVSEPNGNRIGSYKWNATMKTWIYTAE